MLQSLTSVTRTAYTQCGENAAFPSERRPEGFCDWSCMNGDIFSLYNLILQLKLVPRVLDSLNPIMNNLHAYRLKKKSITYFHDIPHVVFSSFLKAMYELCSFVLLCNLYVWTAYMYNSWSKEHVQAIKQETGSPTSVPDLSGIGSNPSCRSNF